MSNSDQRCGNAITNCELCGKAWFECPVIVCVDCKLGKKQCEGIKVDDDTFVCNACSTFKVGDRVSCFVQGDWKLGRIVGAMLIGSKLKAGWQVHLDEHAILEWTPVDKSETVQRLRHSDEPLPDKAMPLSERQIRSGRFNVTNEGQGGVTTISNLTSEPVGNAATGYIAPDEPIETMSAGTPVTCEMCGKHWSKCDCPTFEVGDKYIMTDYHNFPVEIVSIVNNLVTVKYKTGYTTRHGIPYIQGKIGSGAWVTETLDAQIAAQERKVSEIAKLLDSVKADYRAAIEELGRLGALQDSAK